MSIPLHFYCDETSHRGHQFAAVGGLACRPERIDTIDQEIVRLKTAHSYRSEIKWEKVSRRYLPFFEDMVDYFFSLMMANHVHFHVVLCDFNNYDHRLSNDGFKETSVSKTYYQLFLHRLCHRYGEQCDLHFRPDSGDCTRHLPRYIRTLNQESWIRFGSRPVKTIYPVKDSSFYPILGMNDLILGSIAAHRNGRHLKQGASEHKNALGDKIRTSFGLSDYAKSTPIGSDRKWTIWNWQGRATSSRLTPSC